jgi:hypothetical protein
MPTLCVAQWPSGHMRLAKDFLRPRSPVARHGSACATRNNGCSGHDVRPVVTLRCMLVPPHKRNRLCDRRCGHQPGRWVPARLDERRAPLLLEFQCAWWVRAASMTDGGSDDQWSGVVKLLQILSGKGALIITDIEQSGAPQIVARMCEQQMKPWHTVRCAAAFRAAVATACVQQRPPLQHIGHPAPSSTSRHHAITPSPPPPTPCAHDPARRQRVHAASPTRASSALCRVLWRLQALLAQDACALSHARCMLAASVSKLFPSLPLLTLGHAP